MDRRLRVRVVLGVAMSVVVIVAWFVPHLLQVYDASQDETAGAKATAGLIFTAPFDQLLVPALAWIDGFSQEDGIRLAPLHARCTPRDWHEPVPAETP